MLFFFTIKFHDHRDHAGVFVDIIARVILILRQKRGQQVSLSTFFGTIKRSATQNSPFATKRKPTIQLTSNLPKLDRTDGDGDDGDVDDDSDGDGDSLEQ